MSENKLTELNKIAFIVCPLAIFGYLTIVFCGTLMDVSFCKSEGCELAGSIIKISKEEMYLLGMFSNLFLAMLGFLLVYKKEELARIAFLVILASMIIAETIFLGYMFIASGGETCIICLLFYLMMILTFIVASKASEKATRKGIAKDLKDIEEKRFNYSSFKIFTGVVSVVVFFAITLLNYNPASSEEVIPLKEGYSLISSPTCKFCKEIKADLKEKNINYYDRDAKSNLDFIKMMGGKTIPVLILKEKDKISVFNTFNSVKKHLASVTIERLMSSVIKKGKQNGTRSALFGSEAALSTTELSRDRLISTLSDNPLSLVEEGPAGCSPTDTAHKTEESCD